MPVKTKIHAITPKIVMDWEQATKKASALEEEIIDRIDYILHFWFAAFGAKLEYWYFDGADEGEAGPIKMNIDSIWNFYVEVKNFPDNDMIFIDKDGDEYSWQSEIPTRWLYDDSFEEEITKGKAEYERREAERLAKKKQKAADKKTTGFKACRRCKEETFKRRASCSSQNIIRIHNGRNSYHR